MIIVEPIALTADTAVLRRRDYDALLKAYEDAADALAMAEVRGKRPESQSMFRSSWPREFLSAARTRFESGGSIALTLATLAREAAIAPSYVSEIENGKKRGSVRALAALAKVLRVNIEDLLAPDR